MTQRGRAVTTVPPACDRVQVCPHDSSHDAALRGMTTLLGRRPWLAPPAVPKLWAWPAITAPDRGAVRCAVLVAARSGEHGRDLWGFGSGFLVGGRLVLTAGHVLTEGR